MARELELDRMLEAFGVLDGTRGTDRAKRAVRIADVQPALEFPREPKSKPTAGASPTKAEVDAIVSDIATIYRMMGALADALRARIK